MPTTEPNTLPEYADVITDGIVDLSAALTGAAEACTRLQYDVRPLREPITEQTAPGRPVTLRPTSELAALVTDPAAVTLSALAEIAAMVAGAQRALTIAAAAISPLVDDQVCGAF